MESKKIVVAPISGGYFPCQVSILMRLCKAGYAPDIMFGSSGGNIALFITEAGKWTYDKVLEVCRDLNSDMFCRSYFCVSFISLMIGYLNGAFYKKGKGVEAFMNKYFTDSSIQEREMWTGTYNCAKRKAQLFCNVSASKSILCKDVDMDNISVTLPPIYANGNISVISNYSIASASVPSVVPSVNIGNCQYRDGGVSSASPISMLSEHLGCYNNINILYISSFNVDATEFQIDTGTALRVGLNTVQEILRYQVIADRSSALSMIIVDKDKLLNYVEFTYDDVNLKKVLSYYHCINSSVLEIYPIDAHTVDITSFCGVDVEGIINRIYDRCRCRLWWTSNDDKYDEYIKESLQD